MKESESPIAENADTFASIDHEELRGISRTVAEIEWLLLILTLLYQVVGGPPEPGAAAVSMALFFYAAFILAFHYVNFYRTESRWKVAIETWVAIVFITWVVWFAGRLQSPLLNLYLLPIITSALALGKRATLFAMALVAVCYVLLGGAGTASSLLSPDGAAVLLAQLGPVLLVAYVTTMFSADIRYGLSQAKLLSETDALTGLYNMRGFALVMDRAFAQAVRYSRPLSVMMIDSDDLKAVNDEHGHDAGNQLLRLTARGIKSHLRTTDVLARYGGDEFVVLLPDTDAGATRDVAERIRESIAGTPLELRGTNVWISVSIGVAGYPGDGRAMDTVIQRADEAMYRAKKEGRNRVVSYFASEKA